MQIHTPRTRDDLARLLTPMHLEASVFERAVSVGAAQSRTFSQGAPTSAANTTRWFRTVEAMHEQLMQLKLGWRRSDPQNLPYFSQADLHMGIVISSGDEFTGVTWGIPSTKNPKGAAFARRVEDNGQMTLLGEPTTDGDQIYIDELWIVLYDEREGSVFLELSRPILMSGNQIDGWSERIIFPPFDLALGAFSFDEPDEDFGFTVARR